MQALPALPGGGNLHNHLDVVTSKYGTNGNFKEHCPGDVQRIPDWLRKLRSSVRSAESGIRWLEMRVLVQGQPAQQIDQVVHFSEVFDWPTAVLLRIPVLNPQDGQLVMTTPPYDLQRKLSAQVYGLILRLISYDNRKFYQGVPEDDGFAILRHLRVSQADEGGHYDLLDQQRSALSCNGFADYSGFKAAALQLKADFDQAALTGLIRPDEAWPLSQAKNLVADLMQPLLGNGLADWIADTVNLHATLEQTFEKASTLYRVRVRQMKHKRPVSHMLHDAQEAPELAPVLDSDLENYLYKPDSSDSRYRREDSRGYPPRDRMRNQSRPQDNRRQQHRGSSALSALIPLLAAAVAQHQHQPPQRPFDDRRRGPPNGYPPQPSGYQGQSGSCNRGRGGDRNSGGNRGSRVVFGRGNDRHNNDRNAYGNRGARQYLHQHEGDDHRYVEDQPQAQHHDEGHYDDLYDQDAVHGCFADVDQQ